MLKNKHALAVTLAVWQALLFVLMGVWARMMSESFTAYQQVFWRFLAAAALCWILFGMSFRRSTFRQLRAKDWAVYALRAFLNFGVGVLLYTIAVLHADLAQVSFIQSLPITGLLAWIMFREKLGRNSLPFILFSVVGLALVTSISPTSFQPTFGTIVAIVSMLGFSVSYLMVRYHPKGLTNFHNTTLMLSFAWIAPLILLLGTHQSILPNHLSLLSLVAFVISVSMNIVQLYTLNFIFSNLKGYVAGNVLLLEGVFALVIGFIFYGETLSLIELLGAAIIVFCAIALSRISLKQERSPEGEI